MRTSPRSLIWMMIGLLLVVIVAAVAGWAAARWRVNRRTKVQDRMAAVEEEYRKMVAPVAGRAEFVSAVALITDPSKYNGRRVILSGIWTVGFEDSLLDLENSAQNFWIWVEPDWDKINEPMGDFSHRKEREEETKRAQSGHWSFRIVAEGTFRYKKFDPNGMITGFGHMGCSDGFFLFDRLFEFEECQNEVPKQDQQPTAVPAVPPAAQESRR